MSRNSNFVVYFHVWKYPQYNFSIFFLMRWKITKIWHLNFPWNYTTILQKSKLSLYLKEQRITKIVTTRYQEAKFWARKATICIYSEFGVVVIKLRSTRCSNCSSRAELVRLESCNYCLKCWVIWLLLPQTLRICITSTVSFVVKVTVICVTFYHVILINNLLALIGTSKLLYV